MARPYEIEARLLGKDRQYRWFLIRVNPVRDERGASFDGMEHGRISRTASERKRSCGKTKESCDGSSMPYPKIVVSLAPDGSTLYANQAVLDYTGLSLEEVKADDFRARVFHPDDVERVRDERQEALARGDPV